MYSYIGKKDILNLVQNNRKGIVIENITTKDISEYINNLLIIIENNGINTNIFTKAKVKKNTKYTLLLVIKKNVKISTYDYMDIKSIVQNIVPCKTLKEYFRSTTL